MEIIYIPLWSYSNDMLTYATDEYNEFTFHYGPIQIQMSQAIDYHSTIYIPLWSYSNIALFLHLLRYFHIYIPLWSYSNISSMRMYIHLSIFTFHYGPIQITFECSTCILDTYLHSTMVLFKSQLLRISKIM